jgi:capsular polysaccharide biosynthesis protein
MESLTLVVGSEREVIALPVGRAIIVERLLNTSVVGYVPFDRRDAKLANHSHGLFSSFVMSLLRRRILQFVASLDAQDFPKKIYLRRTSGGRKLINGVEVEKALAAKGYVAVEPEKLTFLQQIAMFSKAEKIVGSSGAALSNLIFLPPKSNIYILIGKYDGTSYWYWQNIAIASGNVVKYVLGSVPDGSKHGIHADFKIDIGDMLKLL